MEGEETPVDAGTGDECRIIASPNAVQMVFRVAKVEDGRGERKRIGSASQKTTKRGGTSRYPTDTPDYNGVGFKIVGPGRFANGSIYLTLPPTRNLLHSSPRRARATAWGMMAESLVGPATSGVAKTTPYTYFRGQQTDGPNKDASRRFGPEIQATHV